MRYFSQYVISENIYAFVLKYFTMTTKFTCFQLVDKEIMFLTELFDHKYIIY